MRPYPLTVLQGGIDRLRIKGSAAANKLYDLVNAFITNAGTVIPREGTIRAATLTSATAGLAAVDGVFHIFTNTATLGTPSSVAVVSTTSGGTITTGTWYYKVTAIDLVGETTPSSEASVLATGPTASNTVTWLPVPGATGFNVYSSSALGGENRYQAVGNVTSYIDTGAGYTAGVPPATNGTILTVPSGYVLDVLVDPKDASQTISKIWFAKPFMGFLYVVPEFANGNIFHYWLQNNGTWATNTVYTSASIILPTAPNGLAYQGVRDFPPNPLWTPETVIALNDIVEPTAATGYGYKAVALASNQGTQTSGLPPVLLLHGDGTNGSTVFPDSSVNAYPMTAQGAAVVDTSSPKFGTGSINFPSNGSYLTTPLTTALDLHHGAHTVDGWFRVAVTPPVHVLILFSDWSTFSAPSDFFRAYLNGVGWDGTGASCQVQIDGYSGWAGTSISGPGSVAINDAAWHHFAIQTDPVTGYGQVWVDGVYGPKITNYVNDASANPNTLFYLGGDSSAPLQTNWFVGHIDEFRVTDGLRYAFDANFTPPAAAYNVINNAHTGPSEPIWPTVSAATIQEFGDFDASSSSSGTFQNSTTTTAAVPLGANITNRYGNSSAIAGQGAPASSGLTLPVTASSVVTTWQSGTTYAPGAVVRPTVNQGGFIDAIPNGDFENGNDGSWVLAAGVIYSTSAGPGPYQGAYCLQLTAAGGEVSATMANYGAVTPGQSVTASAYVNPHSSGADLSMGIRLRWYDSTDTFISATAGPVEQNGGYRKTTVTGVAPSNAVHVRVQIYAGNGTSAKQGYADLVSWNLEQPSAVSNFLYEAVQPAAASSATTEPAWPTTAGNMVIDGGVTWKAIGTSIITWEAIPLMLSGNTEPKWPTTVGLSVSDPSTFTDVNGVLTSACSLSWKCVDRHIADAKDPDTNAVALGASHVFAGDKDIVPYSAAVDPTDWTSTNNAGYLPTGLNNYGDNPVAMLALYRSNLMVFNAGGYQMWQIDPDPANMALLDAQPVGSIWPRAAQSVANDLLFLTEVGVRNLGTVGATANMAIGNTGQPVDPLVQAQMTSGTYSPISLYYPGRGQYWLIFGPQAFVLTINGSNQKTWSRYVFPNAIVDSTLNAGVLYLRTANNLVWKLDPNTLVDDSNAITTGTNTSFSSVLQWPYLDLGALGLNKMMVGVDLVGDGSCYIQVGFNQADKTTFNDNALFSTSSNVTTPYFVAVDDTVPGEPLPIPINAPSYTLILTFPSVVSSAPNAWTWEAANLYLTNAGGAGATG